ncbi:hypothetical protein [Pilimelia columellifera]|uniref:Uncharacterized protein n=1 Tax=Pilimelia columellifera subsp. columellifera TaxID=706583 RepID=A0ABP6AU13_9ACTN
MSTQTIDETRVEALFVSAAQRSEQPSAQAVRAAVSDSIDAFGVVGCAALVAQEYGEHPETAASRMRWALTAVHDAYPA